MYFLQVFINAFVVIYYRFYRNNYFTGNNIVDAPRNLSKFSHELIKMCCYLQRKYAIADLLRFPVRRNKQTNKQKMFSSTGKSSGCCTLRFPCHKRHFCLIVFSSSIEREGITAYSWYNVTGYINVLQAINNIHATING